MRRFDVVAAFTAALLFTACGEKPAPAPAAPAAAHEDHKPPHGGELIELGAEEGHLEMMHDHVGGKLTVYVFGSDLSKPLSIERPVVNIMTPDGPAEVVLTSIDPKADGTAHTWKGEHKGLAVEPWDGSIRVKIGGKPFSSKLEPEGHEHK